MCFSSNLLLKLKLKLSLSLLQCHCLLNLFLKPQTLPRSRQCRGAVPAPISPSTSHFLLTFFLFTDFNLNLNLHPAHRFALSDASVSWFVCKSGQDWKETSCKLRLPSMTGERQCAHGLPLWLNQFNCLRDTAMEFSQGKDRESESKKVRDRPDD